VNASAAVVILAVLTLCLLAWLFSRNQEVEPPNPICPYTATGRENTYRVCGRWCHLYLPDRPPHCPFLRWAESLQDRRPADALL
jgi:hypothetical protein